MSNSVNLGWFGVHQIAAQEFLVFALNWSIFVLGYF